MNLEWEKENGWKKNDKAAKYEKVQQKAKYWKKYIKTKKKLNQYL